jgi:alkylation response protein AidB-like acyl-CoA dehydrogenase
MDFQDTPEEAAFREEVRAFLTEHAPSDGARYADEAHDLGALVEQQRAWQKRLFPHGWAVPSWPTEFGGRNLSPSQNIIWQQEKSRVGLGGSILTGGLDMLGPTLIRHGNDAQRERFLEATAQGDIVWCQLFSEPGAGSDLAALSTRAVREGEGWRVNGQKVWSSFANHADWGFLLVRSDPQAAKHAGITFLLVEMRSPGVEVRPLIEMTGGNHFNEVFFNDVDVPDENRVGPAGGGWPVARTTLMHERMSIGNFSALEPVERLLALVRERGGADPVTADELARLYSWARGLDLLNARVVTKLGHGQNPSAESSVMKNAISDILLRVADLAMRVLGSDSLAGEGAWAREFLFAPSMHIGGGTEEVMKNLVAEQVLGLPREPDPWKGVPFKDLPR